MIDNPWINRAAAVICLIALYAIGYTGGREQASYAHHDHNACQQEMPR
jgi:hypothetical protein